MQVNCHSNCRYECGCESLSRSQVWRKLEADVSRLIHRISRTADSDMREQSGRRSVSLALCSTAARCRQHRRSSSGDVALLHQRLGTVTPRLGDARAPHSLRDSVCSAACCETWRVPRQLGRPIRLVRLPCPSTHVECPNCRRMIRHMAMRAPAGAVRRYGLRVWWGRHSPNACCATTAG